jgi:hypothetical protein
MAEIVPPSNQRIFHCPHCDGKITIPRNLPPTTGPCPLCGGIITSPADDTESVDDTASNPTRTERSVIIDPEEQRSILPAFLTLGIVAALIGGIIWYAAKESKKVAASNSGVVKKVDPVLNEAHYLREGWKAEATRVLTSFLQATTVKDKLPFVLNGAELATKMEETYGGGLIVDTNTPIGDFLPSDLSESDTGRGLFLMIYDQPAGLEMKEFFRPLASLEVQYGLEEADLLLSTVANVGNFSSEPLKILAFFKRTPEGLKLDWELFIQNKYRTLKNFIDLPELGQKKVFRVIISEDVPDQTTAPIGTRTYRLVDPANTADGPKVNVTVDSEIGRAINPINWRGTEGGQPITQSATVELTWAGTAKMPVLTISRFICWEFIGLGGLETPAAAEKK